jgi:hypothetical protein
MPFPILGTPKPAFFDSSGSPLVSGTLAILDPADDTNKASYPTYDDAVLLQNANSNPITLDSRGEPDGVELWGLDGQDYKLTLKDSAGATIWTADDIRLPIVHGDSVQTLAEANAGITPTDVSYPEGDLRRYGAQIDGVTDDSTAVQNWLDAAGSSSLRRLHPGGTCVCKDITIPDIPGIEIYAQQGYTRGLSDLGSVFEAASGASYIMASAAYVNNASVVGFPLTIRSLRFDGNSIAANNLLLCNWNSLVEDVESFGATSDGLQFTANTADSTSITGTMVNNKIIRGIYRNNGRHGINLRHDTTGSIGTDWDIDSPKCYVNGENGIHIDSAAGGWLKGVHCYSNTEYDVSILLGRLGLRITECYLEATNTVSITEWGASQSRQAALRFEGFTAGEEAIVANSVLRGMIKIDAGGAASRLLSVGNVYNTDDAHIHIPFTTNVVAKSVGDNFKTGDPFRSNNSASSAKFLALGCTSEAVSETQTFSGLHTVISGDVPLRMDSGIQTFTAADATPSIRGSKTWFTDTGALTITDLDDGLAGDEVTIISKGAVVFDTTGTNLVGSSVNLTTASGDVTRWACEDGTTWRLIAFVDVDVDNSAGA